MGFFVSVPTVRPSGMGSRVRRASETCDRVQTLPHGMSYQRTKGQWSKGRKLSARVPRLMSDLTDAALAAEGDYVAFERLFRKYLSPVYSLCARLSGSRDRGAELTEEVFVSAWARLRQFRGGDGFDVWLRRLAADVTLTKSETHDGDAATVEPGGESIDLDQAVDRLPTEARRILVLHDVEGFRHEDIAEILGITPGASIAKLRRARVLLKESLGR
ncbi:MAG TPA: RNA polymerase sigma factor [Gemmatimonadaceae bacterium]|nr:RNA polymerase sigma factor [Gemmatimonadaceae bacterium]